LNPFEIQTNFKFYLFPDFLALILLGIIISSQKEGCSFQIYLPLSKVLKFLEKRKCNFNIFQT
jgi:hypothetical protein